MHRFLFLPTCLLFVVLPLAAQTISLAEENVRLDYAQVLSVEPVYETLQAVKTEVVCEPAEKRDRTDKEGRGRLARMWSSVRGWFGGDEPEAEDASPQPAKQRCRTVPLQRELQTPVAYDVDYMYKGMKYRTRLPEDPGNRLRVRISVSPYLPGLVEQDGGE